MNLQALDYINKNCEEILEQASNDNNVNEAMIKGVAKFAVANGYEKLSPNQKFHFDETIRPLIEDVQCSGYTHELEEVHQECSSTLPDDRLVEYYQNDGAYCDSCQGQNDADAHTKATFMRD
ncbi:hypothetical protein [Comamonas sediminis]|uniref:Uncharacterized protein n=1 Tax=Comamonas sediminis TaxID=1783360 RepID=A0ABV4AZJ7_9BURK